MHLKRMFFHVVGCVCIYYVENNPGSTKPNSCKTLFVATNDINYQYNQLSILTISCYY